MTTRPALQTSSKPPPFAYVSIFLLGLLSFAGALTLRDYVVESNWRELARVTSPDGQVDAVLVAPILHAIRADSALYLVPKGEPVQSWGSLMRGTKFTQLKLNFEREHLLIVSYDHGCIDSFSNLWHSDDVGNGTYYVEIQLSPTSGPACISEASGRPRTAIANQAIAVPAR